MMFIIKQLFNKLNRKFCNHDNYDVLGKFGPTKGRHKTWISCHCKDCGQHFTYEISGGRKYLTDGPGYGIKKI